MEDIELFIESWEIEKSFKVTTRRPVRNCTEHDCSHCIELLNRKAFIPCHDKVSWKQPSLRTVMLDMLRGKASVFVFLP